jgi:phosphatidylserine/phosphatidylglycerophosphate/cardiolipin synthase-like enzyme
MHNKVLLTDSIVLTGSFNLSRNAESNAENVLAIPDLALVDAYREYVETLIVKYDK